MFIVTPQDSQVCLQFLILDDDTIEDSENFTVTIVRSGQIVGNTTVIIEDNEGECVCLCTGMYVHVYIYLYTILFHYLPGSPNCKYFDMLIVGCWMD